MMTDERFNQYLDTFTLDELQAVLNSPLMNSALMTAEQADRLEARWLEKKIEWCLEQPEPATQAYGRAIATSAPRSLVKWAEDEYKRGTELKDVGEALSTLVRAVVHSVSMPQAKPQESRQALSLDIVTMLLSNIEPEHVKNLARTILREELRR